MLRRPTRSVTVINHDEPAHESQFVTGLIELEQNGYVAAADEIRREDLPDFLFEEQPTEIGVTPAVAEERWSEPFASGEALSDKVMSYGRKTPSPIDNLPHSSMRGGRKGGRK